MPVSNMDVTLKYVVNHWEGTSGPRILSGLDARFISVMQKTCDGRKKQKEGKTPVKYFSCSISTF